MVNSTRGVRDMGSKYEKETGDHGNLVLHVWKKRHLKERMTPGGKD
jgi:hypothetical protein